MMSGVNWACSAKGLTITDADSVGVLRCEREGAIREGSVNGVNNWRETVTAIVS